jgi:outer membrane protein assembly factor BamB
VRKWLKWILIVLGVLIITMVVYVVLNWSWISIVAGTEGLSEKSGKIPDPTGPNSDSLEFGEADWPCWYGPDGDRISREKGIRTDWSDGLNPVWEVDYLCQGAASASWSSPVIQGNRLVISGRDTGNDLVFCLNPKDGSLIWYQTYPAITATNHGSGPRATPFIDNDKIYTFGRGGDLVCLNLYDGQIRWHKNVMNEGGEEPTWGHSSSPLVFGDLVLVQGGGTCRVIAFNKNTGEVVWKSGRGLPGYAALKMMELSDTQILLAFHGKGLAAIDPVDGKELWNVDWVTEYDVNATTPVVIDDRVFITSGYGTGSMLMKVNFEEVNTLWRIENFAALHSDPYIINGYIYGYSGDSFQNKGSFRCLDLSNGEEKWSTNDIGWGTCTLVDGYLLCSDIKGNIFLVKPDPDKFDLVTSLPSALGDVKGPVWSTPVVANRHLYLRFKQKLICYEILKRLPV